MHEVWLVAFSLLIYFVMIMCSDFVDKFGKLNFYIYLIRVYVCLIKCDWWLKSIVHSDQLAVVCKNIYLVTA